MSIRHSHAAALDVSDAARALPRLLMAIPLLSYADRFAMLPLLGPAAAGLHTTTGAITAALQLYFLLFGVMQPVSGAISDRVGRVRVLQGALFGLGAADAMASLARSPGMLITGRALAGACSAALLPTAVVYISDRVAFQQRQRTIAGLLAAGASGAALATLLAGALASYASWRDAFALLAVAAPVLAVAVGRLPEPSRRRSGAVGGLRRLAAEPWLRLLLPLALVEGAVMVGFVAFLAPALEAGGHSAAVAGLVMAGYGLACLAGVPLVRVASRRLAPAAVLLVGGVPLAAGYLVAAVSQDTPAVLAASVLLGLAFAGFHSAFQTWATELVPQARGAATSLVAGAVFTGAGVATALAGRLADAHRFGALFLLAAAIAVPVVGVTAAARARYRPQLASQATR